ncbi:MAG: hypothetical protein JNK56_00485 [Myxococcales bacterium]|nr:hypothetical protein [Myxococcales bacterium]
MAWPRSLLLTLLLLPACPGATDGSSTSQADTTATTTATTAADTTGAPTEPISGEPVTTSGSGDTGDTGQDACTNRPSGDWNACKDGSGTNNSLCGFVDNGGDGSLTCLSPQSGSFNVCGIRDCVDDCDCWAPPKTGDAPAVCTAVFGDGGKACILYCLNGQKCPDGMMCNSTTCYWPDP